MKRTYIRDGRAPVPHREATSRVMSANKAKDTKPELLLRKALWAAGVRGYRLHPKKLPGRPDIAFPSKRLAIFVNGCFWHRCHSCAPDLPKSNSEFWRNKFTKNIERDKMNRELLEQANWKVITVWECEIQQGIHEVVANVQNALG